MSLDIAKLALPPKRHWLGTSTVKYSVTWDHRWDLSSLHIIFLHYWTFKSCTEWASLWHDSQHTHQVVATKILPLLDEFIVVLLPLIDVLWYMKNQQKAMIEQSSQYTHKMICVYISEMAFVITHTINMCAVLNYVILCLYFKKCSTLVLSNNNREYLFESTAAEKWQNKGWINSNNENKTDYRRSSKSHQGNIGGWLRKKAVVK